MGLVAGAGVCLLRHCLSLLVAAVLLGASAAHAQGPTGKIARVSVTGNVNVPARDILAHVAEKAGDTYDAAAASEDQAAIKAMGLFNGDVAVTTTPDPAGGIDVSFKVSENPVVKRIKFTANTPDGQPTIPAVTLKSLMRTREGRTLNTQTLRRDLDALFNHQTGEVRKQGLVFDVSPAISIEPKTGVLTIPLTESYIRQLRIEGSRPGTEARARRAMQARAGGLLNLNTLQDDMARIYGAGGFTSVGPYRIEAAGAGKADVIVPVRESGRAAVVHAPSTGHTSTFSYTTTLGGLPIIPVRINDRVTAHLLLNTTANLTVISTGLAATLGLTPAPMLEGGKPYLIDGKPGQSVLIARMQFGANRSIYASSVALPVLDMAAISAQAGLTIDGVLGFNSLAGVAVGIDFPCRRITFWDHGSLSRSERRALGFAGAEAPLAAPAGDYRFTVPAKLENGPASRSLPMGLGTASTLSVLPRAEVQALQAATFTGDDQPPTDRVRVPRVTLGGLTLPSALFSVGDGSEPPLIGLNVLSRYRVLLDCPAQKMFFAPAVSVAPPPAGRSGLAVPFTYDPLTQGVAVIQVSINGHPPLPFVFDTGLSVPMVLDRAAARELGLMANGTAASRMNGSIQATSFLVSSAVLQGRTPADNVAVTLEEAPVIDLGQLQQSLSGPPAAGIIGAGMLTDTAVRMDFGARTLTFFPAPSQVPTPQGAVSLPLAEANTENAYSAAVSPVPGQTIRMLVDTGSWGTQVPFASAAALRPSAAASAGTSTLSSLSLGEDLDVPRFSVGGFSLRGVEVTAVPVEEAQWPPATLGMNLLSRSRVTLDVPKMRLLLEPLSPPPPAFRAGYSGLILDQSGDHFQIKTVDADSPGAAAGLRAGDFVLSIDGRPLAGLRLYTANHLASGEADRPAAFVVNQAGVVRAVRFRRMSLFQSPPQVLFGLIGRRDAAGPLVVKAVLPGCPADRAGLALGDEVTAFGDVPAATITGETLAQVSHQAHLTLTFHRPGEAAPRTVKLDRPSAPRGARPGG